MRKMILGLAPAILLMSTAAQAAPPAWKVSEVSGKVQLSENGRSRAAVRGALLSSGAMITTAPGARAVIVRGEEFVVISPNTRLRVPQAAEADGIMQIIEDFGTALFKIKKKSTPHFGVKTPYLAAVVKGTTFTVTVGEEGGTVQVTEGAVEVSTLDGGATDLVTPGAIAMVGASDLYRLSVEGDASKVLRSSEAPAAGTVTTGRVPAAAAAYAGPAASRIDITAPVGEAPKPLGETTAGLVGGPAAVELAVAEAADQTRGAKRFERGKDDNVPGGGNDNKPDQGKPDKDKPEKPDKDKPEKPDEPKPDKDKPEEPKADEPKPDKDEADAPAPDQPDEPKPDKDKPDDIGKGDKGDDKDGKDGTDDGAASVPSGGDSGASAGGESAPVSGGSDGSAGEGSGSAGGGSSGGDQDLSGDSGSDDSGSDGADSGSDGADSGSNDADSGSADSGSDNADSGSDGEDSSGSGSDGSGSGSDNSGSGSDGSGSGSDGTGSSGGGSGSGGIDGGVALPGTDLGDAIGDDDIGGTDDDDDGDDGDSDGDDDDSGSDGICLLGLICIGDDDD